MSLKARIAWTTIVVTAVAFVVTGLVVFSLMRVSLVREQRQTMMAQVQLWVRTRRVPPQASLVLLTSGAQSYIYKQGQSFPVPVAQVNAQREGFLTYQGHLEAWARAGNTLMVVAQPISVVNRPLASLRDLILRTDGAALVLLGLLALWLSSVGLRPLQKVNRLASDIAETGRLDLRIQTDHLPPEVSSLGAALNQMLDRLKQAFGELEETQQRERRLIADMSHDLRTPLHILEGNLEMLSHPALPQSEWEGAMEDARSEARRIADMVEQLLLIARGELPVPKEARPLSLTALASETAGRFRARLEGRQLEVGGDPVTIRGDAEQAERLLEILLDNAVKYTDPGQGKIQVQVKALDEGRAELSVEDNGVGISEEDLPHIFERFYRADRARTRAGFGLGLSLARHIVSSMGGRIGVESRFGTGTVFRCVFPREDA